MTGKRKTARKAKTEEEVKPLMVSEASEAFAVLKFYDYYAKSKESVWHNHKD